MFASHGTTPFREVAELIEPTVRDLGFELVQVRLMGGERRTLQVMAEPAERGRTMTVEDCAEISRAVSAVLDVADPVPGAYTLEVSSPGIDRPLVRLEDFERFAAHEARIETIELVEGRKRFRGLLAGRDGEHILIDVEGARFRIPYATVKRAKLVLTDALLQAAAAAQGQDRD